jgi:AraC-like DNA-binding protein
VFASMPHYPIELELGLDPPLSPFEDAIVTRPLHDLLISKMTNGAGQIVLDRSDAGYFLIYVNVDGVVAVSSAERRMTLNDGEVVLLDGARHSTVHRRQPGSSYIIRIPRGRMLQLSFVAEAQVMTALAAGAGLLRVFLTYLNAVFENADETSRRLDHLAYRHVCDLISLLLEPGETAATGAERRPGEGQGALALRFEAARSYIVEHAHERISIQQAADHLGITERHLQRLFETSGTTFTAFVNDIRLTRAYALLCDRQSDKLKIRSICFKAGFRDISHFNRLFRARYECTPAEVRLRRQEHASPEAVASGEQ